jgi:hypothetical protein
MMISLYVVLSEEKKQKLSELQNEIHRLQSEFIKNAQMPGGTVQITPGSSHRPTFHFTPLSFSQCLSSFRIAPLQAMHCIVCRMIFAHASLFNTTLLLCRSNLTSPAYAVFLWGSPLLSAVIIHLLVGCVCAVGTKMGLRRLSASYNVFGFASHSTTSSQFTDPSVTD